MVSFTPWYQRQKMHFPDLREGGQEHLHADELDQQLYLKRDESSYHRGRGGVGLRLGGSRRPVGRRQGQSGIRGQSTGRRNGGACRGLGFTSPHRKVGGELSPRWLWAPNLTHGHSQSRR